MLRPEVRYARADDDVTIAGCPVAVQFAASYPDRTAALVLAGGFAKVTRLGESGLEAGPARAGECASGIARGWGSGVIFGAPQS